MTLRRDYARGEVPAIFERCSSGKTFIPVRIGGKTVTRTGSIGDRELEGRAQTRDRNLAAKATMC